MSHRRHRLIVGLLTAVAGLLALNLFRAAEPRAEAQPGSINLFTGICADGSSGYLFRLNTAGRIEVFDTLPFGQPTREPRWIGWRPVQ